jgi:hypothetical protein
VGLSRDIFKFKRHDPDLQMVILRLPDDEFAVVVFCHESNDDPFDLSIAERFYAEKDKQGIG